MAEEILFYGAEWCPDCRRSKAYLYNHNIQFKFIDVDKVPGAVKKVEELNEKRGNGPMRVIPTIIIGGKVLAEPSNEELRNALEIEKEQDKELYDVIVVGGGPAGGTAAMYTALYRKKTLLLEKKVVGGQLNTTQDVQNYPGFPEGVSGPDLSNRIEKQTAKFGAEIVTGKHAIKFEKDGDCFEIVTEDGTVYRSRSIILALGSEYRHLGVPGEDQFIGRGVSFCATCDAVFTKGKKVVAIGGGNSGFEESIHLSDYASSIKILNIGDKPSATETLQQKAAKIDKIEVINNAKTLEILGDKFVNGVKYEQNGEEKTVDAGMVFVFIGLIPNTAPVKEFVELDDKNFIKVDRSDMSTSVPGVFAAGDAIRNNLAQATIATGEGTIAAGAARNYLEQHKKE